MNRFILDDGTKLLEIYKYISNNKIYVYLVNELDNSDIYIRELNNNQLIEITDKKLLQDVIYNMVSSIEMFY